MRKYESAGVAVPEILLPKPGVDPSKWAVVACDQYTSEPEYWDKAKAFVGGAPSTLNFIYPEVYLKEPDPEARIRSIRAAMKASLDQELLVSHEALIYVERLAAGKTRHGLVLALDLEQYDYHKGSTSLVRATEGTILERIPPRVKIREGAPLESPHIMVLIDDPADKVIGPIREAKARHSKVYDFDLMMSSGHLTGYRVDDRALETGVMAELEKLAEPARFRAKYALDKEYPVLLYAMGDGNHSLATAKAIWERTKETATDRAAVMSAPTRYALIELVNLHDAALVFEPIHRVLFGVSRDPLEDLRKHYGARLTVEAVGSLAAMKAEVDASTAARQRIGVVRAEGHAVAELRHAESNLPVGSLQVVLDAFMKSGGAHEIDYVHGTEAVGSLGAKAGNVGFYLPAMNKHDLFKSVIEEGALPRKTFSMGEAFEKRFYMECRRI